MKAVYPFLLLFLLASCLGPTEDTIIKPPVDLRQCSVQADCDPTFFCVNGYCLNGIVQDKAVSIEVIPPSSSYYSTQQISELKLLENKKASGEINDIYLQPYINIAGSVSQTTEGNPISVNSEILFIKQDTIVDRPIIFKTTTLLDPDGSYKYSLNIIPGTYDIIVNPADETLPTGYFSNLPPFTESGVHLITLGDLKDYFIINGRIVKNEETQEPVPNVKITGVSTDNLYKSTEGTTDLNGRFSITFPPGERVYDLKIRRSNDEDFIPTVEYIDILVSQNAEFGDLALGIENIEPLDYTNRVIGYDPDNIEVPIKGASVIFSGYWGKGKLSKTVTTLDDGSFSVKLIPGIDYSVSVVPPASSDFTINTFFFREGEETFGAFILNPKAQIFGNVTDYATNLPVNNVKISAAMVETNLKTQSEFYSRGDEAISDQHGNFSLQLDPGKYNIIFLPSKQTYLPMFYIENFSIDDSCNSAETICIEEQNVMLDGSQLVRGRILMENGTPMQNVIVNIYITVTTSTSARSILLGTYTTDAEGYFNIIIPI